MKKIVVDSSSLITISTTCLIKLLKHVSERENVQFIIPRSVYEESVTRPLKIKRFEFNAIRIRDAVKEGYIKIEETNPKTKKLMQEFGKFSAQLCNAKGKNIKLIDKGEAETLGFLKSTESNILMIDERTTRMIIEEPQNLISFLERKHHCPVKVDNNTLSKLNSFLKEIKVMRSVELIALAYQDNSMSEEVSQTKESLEAALFAAKYAGCAVSGSEIKEFMKGVKV